MKIKTFQSLIFLCLMGIVFLGSAQSTTLENIEQNKMNFTKSILKYEWNEPDKVKLLIEPAIIISQGKLLTLGASKFGGTPDLPKAVSWPKYDGKSMMFYGQLNLANIASLDYENLLPKTGMLYFFSYFVAPESEFGTEYEFIMDKAQYKVLYLDVTENDLQKSDFPVDLIEAYHFKPTTMDFELIFQIPPTTECSVFDAAKLNAEDTGTFDSIISDYDNFECKEQIILGTPCPIQYGVDWDWAYSYLDITNIKDPTQKAKIESLRSEFINLFSFPMYDKFEVIGHSNCYFGITKTDLKNKDFDKTVFIMQGT